MFSGRFGGLFLAAFTIVLLFSACSNARSEIPAQVTSEPLEDELSEPLLVELSARAQAADIISRMSLSEKIGQLLIVQFRYGSDGGALTALSKADLSLLDDVRPGGVILFRENFDTVEQVIELVGSLKVASRYPLFLAVDEEGGLVSRLVRSGRIPATPIPRAEDVGATGNPEAAYDVYSVVARELLALGLNMNFAPVADVLTDPDNQVIMTRAFADVPETAAAFVAEAVRGLEENGVVSVVKHFPGHGDSSGDSHFEVIRLPHDLQRLRDVELLPFRSAAEAGAGGVMTAHLYFPEVDGGELPASLSPFFLQELLRREMNYQGLIITDALEMKGLAGVASPEEAGILAIQNGADMLLIPPDPRAQRDALLMDAIYGRISADRLEEALMRIISVKITRGIWYNPEIPDAASAYKVLGNDEHRAMIARALGSGQ
jgi:beta-N-acetylhexosaminidase